ncbi:MAG: hypothetical protein SF162_09590 [bacterium]|nr:hypothetical protein [bacterium]
MEKTRREQKPLSDALAWLELTYSNLKIESYLIFVIVGLLIAVMSVGAHQEAVRQSSLFFGVVPAQTEPSLVNSVLRLVNDYGFAALIAVCYFSNATKGDKRRELTVDALCIAFGLIIPQLVFHGSWLFMAHQFVNTRIPVISALQFNGTTGEWLITFGLVAAFTVTLAQTWRVIRRGRAEAAAPAKPAAKK